MDEAAGSTRPIFRFAPSPNGRLHLGHAYSALLNEQWARRLDGRLLLRVEDIDITRCKPEFVSAMEKDLAWLGLHFEQPVRRQSEHFSDYAAAFSILRERRLVYPCFCSRREVSERVLRIEAQTGESWRQDPDGVPLYPGTCRHLAEEEVHRRMALGEPHAWRLDNEAARHTCADALTYSRRDANGAIPIKAADPALWGDAIIVRREIPTSYHLSVVVDDALQHVTHVVRGQDLEAATDLHVLLQTLLELPTPLYHHHPLLLDEGGEKLAKSRFSESLDALRRRGVTPAEIRRRLGFG